MTGHGTHCDCMMCKMGKSTGMVQTCNDQHCTHPSHTKGEDAQKEQKDDKHGNKCDCC